MSSAASSTSWSPIPRIMKIFEITGLTKVFPIADSLASAGATT